MDRHEQRANKVVAVFQTQVVAERAAERARDAAPGAVSVRIGEQADEVDSLRGEMREEVEGTAFGPGNIGPFTKEMRRGLVPGVLLFGAVGALLALPFALIQMGALPLWGRLVAMALVGAAAGATVGFVAGGGGGERDSEGAQLAAERGVVVAVEGPDPHMVERAAEALAEAGALRVDALDVSGNPFRSESVEESPQERRGRASSF